VNSDGGESKNGGQMSAVAKLLDAMRRGADDAAQEAFNSLVDANGADETWIGPLLIASQTSDDRIRFAVYCCLGNLGALATAPVVDRMLDALEAEREFGLREALCSGLAKLAPADPRVAAAIARRLSQDQSEFVRASAAHALGKLGRAAAPAVPLLAAALNDDSEQVRSGAAIALKLLGRVAASARSEIVAAMKEDPDSSVAVQLQVALKRIDASG
jgi:HEAT repeat protein